MLLLLLVLLLQVTIPMVVGGIRRCGVQDRVGRIAIHCQRVVAAVGAIGVITIATTTIVATADGGWPGTGVVTVAIVVGGASAETDCCRGLRQQQHAGALRLRRG